MITARPSYARVKYALKAIQEHPDLSLRLIVAASALLERFGAVVKVIRDDGFEPAAEIHMVLEGENLVTSAKSTGLGIIELATELGRNPPDALLSIADRYETIATAITGSFMNIPVIHLQGGEVTGSIDEKVRHSVTKLADLHLVSNEQAAQRVRKMGEKDESIYVTGCPSIDLAKQVKENRGLLTQEEMLSNGVGSRISLNEDYLIVMQHSVTYEWNQSDAQIAMTLEAISELGVPTVWFWPNVDAGSDLVSKTIRRYREKGLIENIRFMKNFPPEKFLDLLIGAKCIVGNSSTGIREASYLGVPAVNIGSRQAGRDRGKNVVDVEFDQTAILNAIKDQIAHGPYSSDPLYGDGDAGKKIADVLAKASLPTEKRLTY